MHLEGEDVITRNVEIIEEIAAYVACQSKIVQAIKEVIKSTKKAESLAGGDRIQQNRAVREAEKDLELAYRSAQVKAVREKKRIAEQYTAMAAEATQFAAATAKVTQSATDYVEKLPDPAGMIGPMPLQQFLANKIASADTKAIGVTGLSKQYTTLAIYKDALIDDLEELEETFALNSMILGATATMQAFAGEATHTSAKAVDIPQNEKNVLLTQNANSIENVSEIAKEGTGKNKLEQATAAFKAGIQATADIIAVEHSIGKTAKATEAAALSLGRDEIKEAQTSAKSVKDTISTQVDASLREKGDEVKRTVIENVLNDAIKCINNLNRGNKPDDSVIQEGDRDKVRKYHEQFGKVKADMSLLAGCDPESVLQYHRQAYEFEWVSNLQGAVHRASAVGGDAEDIIGRALGDVKMRHNARLRNFNRYDIALKPQTMAEEEDRLMDDVQLAGSPPRVESLKTRRKREEEEIKKKELYTHTKELHHTGELSACIDKLNEENLRYHKKPKVTQKFD